MPDETRNNASTTDSATEDAARPGAATMWRNKVNLKAQQIITEAQSDRATKLANAHSEAQATVTTAHQQATRTLGQNLQKVLVVSGLLHGFAPDGSISQPDVALPSAVQIMDLLVDGADQRLYYLASSGTDTSTNHQINYMNMTSHDSGTLVMSESRLNRLAFDPLARQIFVTAYDGIYAVDLADNTLNRIVSLPNTMFWAIAVDPKAARIYCLSKPRDVDYHYSLNILDYHGSIIKAVFLGDNDDKLGRYLVVDGRAGYLFGNHPHGIWRAPLDLSETTPFVEGKFIWTMSFDRDSGLLYWIQNGTLFRSMTDSLNAERVCEVTPGFIDSFALVTLSDEVGRIILEGKTKVAEAPAKAAQKVAEAHRQADQTRQDALDKLEKAHADAAQKISSKQKEAADQRKTAQDAAREREALALEVLKNANDGAATTKHNAEQHSQELLAQDREAADSKKTIAQDDLNAKRIELQRA
jgi:hypothetical protein